jgi:hypothetical protein
MLGSFFPALAAMIRVKQRLNQHRQGPQMHQERQEHQHKQQQVSLQQQQTAVMRTLTEARYVVFLRVSHNGANTGKFKNILGKTKRQSNILQPGITQVFIYSFWFNQSNITGPTEV